MLDKEEVVKETVKEEIVKEETTIKNDAKAEVVQTAETNTAQENSKITDVTQTNTAVVETPKAKETGYRSEMNGIEVDFELQYRDQETDMKDIAKRVTEDYVRRGNDASAIQLIQVYLKPTDFTAYYVINNSYEGKIPLF